MMAARKPMRMKNLKAYNSSQSKKCNCDHDPVLHYCSNVGHYRFRKAFQPRCNVTKRRPRVEQTTETARAEEVARVLTALLTSRSVTTGPAPARRSALLISCSRPPHRETLTTTAAAAAAPAAVATDVGGSGRPSDTKTY